MKSVRQLRPRNGMTYCPLRSLKGVDVDRCQGKNPYSLQVLAPAVTHAAHQLQLEALKRLQEAQLTEQMEREKKMAIQAEIQKYERMSAFQRQVERARAHIIDAILTLKCPREGCGAAFLNFSDCFALTCHRCGCGFCGWCLEVAFKLGSECAVASM